MTGLTCRLKRPVDTLEATDLHFQDDFHQGFPKLTEESSKLV